MERLLLDAHGAAEALSMSTRTVERLTASGNLPSVKVGRLRRYRTADLIAFVDGLSVYPVSAGAWSTPRAR